MEIHLALLLACVATFKALVQRYFPRLLGSSGETKFTTSGSCVLQSRSRNAPSFMAANQENAQGANGNYSQQYIVEDTEMVGFEVATSTRSPSKSSLDGRCS